MTAPGDPKTDPAARSNATGRASRWLVPPAASLAIHAGLLIALTAVTIEVTRDRPPDRPARVTLAAPSAAPNPTNTRPTTPATDTSVVEGLSDITAEAVAVPASISEAAARISTNAPPPAAPELQTPDPIAEVITRPSNADASRVGFADIDAAPARTVVFVVDASGAVATAFTFVREELLRSIDRLAPTQRFQVVVFPGPDNTPPVLAPINDGRLALASPASKRAVAEWMETFRPRGQSQPLAGLRIALGLEPDIAMLITRSIERTGPDAAWGAGLDDTLAELDRLNPIDRRNGLRTTSIAAIQLLDEDPTGIMPAIAAIHGSGVSDYRVVPAEALITAEPRPERAIGASEQNAIEAAASILSDLDNAGTALRVFHGLSNTQDRQAAVSQAERALALAARAPDDARARVLAARARSLSLDPAQLASAIRALDQELLYEADADAWRRLAIVDALAASGQEQQAAQRLAQLASDADEIGISDALRARLVTTRVALGAEPDDPDTLLGSEPFVDDLGVTDPYWVLAVAEAQVRAALRAGSPDPTRPLVRLLKRAQRENAPGWAPILTDRIARVADLDPDAIASAPPTARLLAARSWARDPATRDRAATTLRDIADTPSPAQPDALWELGVLERSRGSGDAAASAFATLARAFPDHPDAPDALAGAIALTEPPERLIPLLRQAVDTLPTRPEIELWRYRLAELSAGAERLDALETITPSTREATLARAMYAETVEAMLATAASPESNAALLERTSDFMARHGDPRAADWLARAAHAMLDVNTRQSLDLAERAIAQRRQPPPQAQITAALALIAMDRADEAAQRLASVATALDAEGDRSDLFWQAWTLLLETAGPSDPAIARAHIARLELIDPELGGEPWRRRLLAVRSAATTD